MPTALCLAFYATIVNRNRFFFFLPTESFRAGTIKRKDPETIREGGERLEGLAKEVNFKLEG